ncbi:DUF2207 family protein [Hutsoniella sourekii]
MTGNRRRHIHPLLKSIMVLWALMATLSMGLLTVRAEDFNSMDRTREISYDLQEVNIEGKISAEGNVTFQEIYQIQVDYFNGIKFVVDHQGSTLGDYQVSYLDPETGEAIAMSEDFTGQPETFSLNDDGSEAVFTVHYPASKEEVKIVLTYTLNQLVTNYEDVAELNRNIVGQNTADDFDVHAKIYLPKAVAQKEDFRAWGHGAPQGEVYPRTEDGQSWVEVTVPNNPANQFVQVRTIFPRSLVPNNSNVIERPAKEEIISQEEAVVESDRSSFRQFLLARIGGSLLALVLAWWLLWSGWRYYRQQKEALNPNPIHVPEHKYDLPEDLTPAIMATAVLRATPNADDFSATLLDLARKGYLALEEIERVKRGILNRKGETTVQIRILPQKSNQERPPLQKHERFVLDYVTPVQGDTITLEEIETQIKQSDAIKKQKNRLWERFSNTTEVLGQAKKGGPTLERSRSQRQAWLALFANIGVLILTASVLASTTLPASVASWAQTAGIVTLVLQGIGVLLAILLLVMVYWRPIITAREDQMEKEWKAFARMLDDIGQFDMRSIASLPLWDEYLVYAVSLGVADKVIEAMNATYGQAELEAMTLPRGFYTNPYLIHHLMRQSIHSTIQSATPSPTVSSGAFRGNNTGGFGGGFSSGGGGGSGSGSGMSGF